MGRIKTKGQNKPLVFICSAEHFEDILSNYRY